MLVSIGALAAALAPASASAGNFPAACAGATGDAASLVSAIASANGVAGPDSVSLGAGCTYTLTAANNNWYGPNGLPEIRSNARHATFINTFRCRPADQDEVVRINVDVVEQVASQSPGFIAAAVHRSVDGTRVVNYLQWESAGHLRAMQQSAEFRAIASRFAGLIEFEPHECEVVHVAERREG